MHHFCGIDYGGTAAWSGGLSNDTNQNPDCQSGARDEAILSSHPECSQIFHAEGSEQAMRLNEIHIDRLGVLENISLDNIPGLSVLRGDNRSSKTTLLRFLRNTLLSADSLNPRRPDETHVGSVRVSDLHHRWMLSRYQSVTGQQRTTLQYVDNTDPAVPLKSCFPSWVSDQAFQEILCPDCEEADQFTLLTQLCLDTDGAFETDSEVHRVQMAMAQAARERKGNVQEVGLAQKITELEHQRDVMKDQLEILSGQGPAFHAEIRAGMQSRDQQVDEECEQIHAEIEELEHRIGGLRDRNRLALDPDQLRTLIANLAARRNSWIEIRGSIEQMADEISLSDVPAMSRSSHSVRAVVNRLEEQMQRPSQVQTDRWHQNIEQETAALCRFVTQQQEAAGACERYLESLLSSEASGSIRRVESLLQGQMSALREELERADDLLNDSLPDATLDCASTWHQDFQHDNESSDQTLTSLESNLQLLQQRYSSLQAESDNNTDDLRPMTARLGDLHARLDAVSSLEEVDDLHARLAEIEARLDLLVIQHDVLKRSEYALGQVVAQLSQRSWPAALEIASPWLRRLTDGECIRILADTARSELLVETKTSRRPLHVSQLSQQTQHQLALVLRLALLKAHSATSTRMPLIIDDVFIISEDERGGAAADLLRDTAADGQQIILMTCRNDVSGLMEARGARVYSLTAATLQSLTPPSPPEPVTSLVFKTFDGVAEECPGKRADKVVDGKDNSHCLFYLEPEHSVSDLSGVKVSELNGFTAADIESIEQLLTCSIIDTEEQIQNAGFLITEDRIKELQGQALMTVCVPMLRQRDAELLVAAGIDSVRQLARLRPEVIHELIVRFQRSDSGTRFLQSGRTIDQQQAISWNRWALHARTVDHSLKAAAARRSQTSRSVGILSSSTAYADG